MNILAIIPARGGSKGIPRKNIRPLLGKPLITYSISTAKASKYITDVVVSTDDDEIAFFSKKCDAFIHERNKELANDSTTLDPVILNAYDSYKQCTGKNFDFVITMQPTSPLLSVETLDLAIERILYNSNIDTIISGVKDTHLTWLKENNTFIPNYEKRVNRQFLPEIYKETGGFVISRISNIEKGYRIGGEISIAELKPDEAIDIDGYNDWSLCEFYLKRKRIVFRVSGYKEIGLGHVYNSIVLASEILEHEVIFLVDNKSQLAFDKIREYNFPVFMQVFDDITKDIFNLAPDLVINDCLDNDFSYIKKIKDKGIKVVNIEDLGSGSKNADLVFNAIYPEEEKIENHYYGPEYFCARDEFIFHPTKVISHRIKNVLISFGGVDPNNLTKKVLDSIYDYCKENNIQIKVVLGIGYTNRKSLHFYEDKVEIHQNINNISDYFFEADLAFSSAGRTVYELALIGTPAIVMAQNERELTHFFAYEEFGFQNLGLGQQVDEVEILKKMIEMNDYELRLTMTQLMRSPGIREGKNKVINLIRKLI